jgi:hypothetical protein
MPLLLRDVSTGLKGSHSHQAEGSRELQPRGRGTTLYQFLNRAGEH